MNALPYPSLMVAVLALSLTACSKPAEAPEPERAVRTQLVADGEAGLAHEYAAEVKARIESRLSFRVGGKLLQRRVNLGDSVKAGQVLAQLDPQDLVLAQDGAKASELAARVNRDQTEADYKRYIELRAQGFISAAELERRENAYKAAQAQWAQAKAQSGVQGNQAGYAQLIADAPGVVTSVDAEPGMVVAAGTSIVRVAHDGPRDIVFSVPEDQLGRLRAAAARSGSLKVKLWADDGPARAASLREISAAADPVTRTFLIKADAGQIGAKLGQTATVLVDLPPVHNVIKIPLSAVFQLQGKTSVYVFDPASQTIKAQAITVGGADGNAVVVQSGLKAGQEVVVAGVHVLTPGQKVRRYQAVKATAAASAVAAR